MSGCPVLAPNEYKKRHGRVGQYLHWKICESYKIETCEHWYEHKPQPVVEGDNVTLLWDSPIRTDRTIQANRPDIIVKDLKEKTCLLIDMSIPTDHNIPAKEFDKLSKYRDLEIEIQRMWKLTTSTVPVIAGALSMIKKVVRNILTQFLVSPNYRKSRRLFLRAQHTFYAKLCLFN